MKTKCHEKKNVWNVSDASAMHWNGVENFVCIALLLCDVNGLLFHLCALWSLECLCYGENKPVCHSFSSVFPAEVASK